MRRSGFACLVCCLVGDLAVLIAGPVGAADQRPAINYAFANQLGSGIYTVNGRTVQMYNFSVSVPLRHPDRHRLGFELLLPLSVGLYDFQVKDAIKGFPDFLSTVSLVPALQAEIRLASRWWLMPSAGAGLGKDLSSGGTSFIYVVQGRSLLAARPGAWDLRLGNRLCYSGYTADMDQPTDDIVILESGVDVLRGLGWKVSHREINASVFGINYLYSLSPQFVKQIPQQADIRASWGVGFTLGTFPTWKPLGLPLPRLGLGWGFGDGPGALRIVVGEPFPVRLPTEAEREPNPGDNHAKHP